MKIDIKKIGNSKVICIPDAVLRQCGIDSAVELVVQDNCIVLKPVAPRRDWGKVFKPRHKNNNNIIMISQRIGSSVYLFPIQKSNTSKQETTDKFVEAVGRHVNEYEKNTDYFIKAFKRKLRDIWKF